tara:strand:+ start:232 stop:411 length:180 start_codon:yes stop_codon:yes gene_type:complete
MNQNQKLIKNMENWEENQKQYDIIKYYNGMYDLASTKKNKNTLTEIINILKHRKNGKRN